MLQRRHNFYSMYYCVRCWLAALQLLRRLAEEGECRLVSLMLVSLHVGDECVERVDLLPNHRSAIKSAKLLATSAQVKQQSCFCDTIQHRSAMPLRLSR